MIISCNTIVDRRDHVQYLTVSSGIDIDTTKDCFRRMAENGFAPPPP